MRRLMLLLSVLGVVGLVMTGCKKEQKPAAEPTVQEPKKEEPKAPEPKKEEPAKAEPAADDKKDEAAAGGDKVGVPECDDYLEKYTACLKDKVPEASRGAMETSLQKTREAWKVSAGTPQGKAGLAAACKVASAAASKAMTAFGCTW